MLLGRFVFHTPTSPQTTPPLTPRLLISPLTLPIFPSALTQAHFLAGPLSARGCVTSRVCAPVSAPCTLVTSKSSAPPAPLYVHGISCLKATPRRGSLPYRHIQPFFFFLNTTSPFSCYNDRAHSSTRCPSFLFSSPTFLLLCLPLPVCAIQEDKKWWLVKHA